MLTKLRTVTVLVADLERASQAYENELGYRRVGEAPVRAGDPLVAPALAARDRAGRWLRAPLETLTALRLIEVPEARPPPLCPLGWSANEILVENPDALATRLSRPGSGFEIVGAPAPLSSNPSIVAMQARGPSGELIYFTRIPPEGGSFIREGARTFVDRTFIMVAGGSSLEAMRAFYGTQFGAKVTPPFAGIVGVLQEQYGLTAEQPTLMSLVPISSQFVLELDQHPRASIEQTLSATLGYAAVGLEVDEWPVGPWHRPPTQQTEGLYEGEWVGVLIGAAGERLEIVGPGEIARRSALEKTGDPHAI